jgi:competence protein ComEA
MLTSACDAGNRTTTIEQVLPAPSVTYDLNEVTLEQLNALPGIRKDVARNIINFRKYNRFDRVEDLISVDGIGEKMFLQIRPYFYVSQHRSHPW